MYGCESWTVKKAERRRIDAFELWCWIKTLESPLDCKEIQPVHSKGDQSWVFFGRMMLKLKLQYFGHLMQRIDSLEKTHAGRDWGQEEKGTTEASWLMAPLTQWTWVWVNSGSWWWTGRPGVQQFIGSQRVGLDWATELNWTDSHNSSALFLKTERCKFCNTPHLFVSGWPCISKWFYSEPD